MASKIGATIALDGEKEFKKAVSEINAGLRVTASQLTLVTAKYADNATSVKALTERGAVLENQISGQREKIEKLRAALTNSANTYGEADRKTMNWQVSLNKAEAELAKMEGELKNNSDALQNATKDMEKYGLAEDEVSEKSRGFGNVLSDIIGKLGIKLPAGADNAVKALDKQKISTMALIGVTTGLIAGFSKLTIETAKTADDLLTLSSTTGMTTDTLQELRYASELVDVSVETMSTSMTRMIRNMGNAKDGSKEAGEGFKKLRLRITEMGQLKDSEKMFYEVIDALGKVRNETERDAIAMQIFGRSARELNPLIEAGSKSLKEFGEEAKKMGYVMDRETLEKFGALDDAMQKFDNQTKSLKNSLAIVMLPILTELFETLNKIDPKIIATVAIIASVATVAVTVAVAVKKVSDVFSTMSVATLKTTAIVVGVVAALIALAAIISVIIGKGDDLDRTMANVGNTVGNMTGTVTGAGNRIGRNAKGTSNWRGGLTWVGEEGPELIDMPAGARIFDNKRSMQMALAGAGGGESRDTYNIYVQAKDLDEAAKVVRVFESLKQRKRQGVN